MKISNIGMNIGISEFKIPSIKISESLNVSDIECPIKDILAKIEKS
jgi:hypothetical protein